MSKLFDVYRKEKEFGVELSAQWYFNNGGYTAAYFEYFNFFKWRLCFPTAWTFCHRLHVKGDPKQGTEKEFVLRFQYDCGDADPKKREPRFSFFTLEFLNPFEARWFYLCLKLPRQRTFKTVLHCGYRVSKASRDYLRQQTVEAVIKGRSRFEVPKNHDGGQRQWHSQKPVLKVR